MTLDAELADVRADQPVAIGRAVRFVAGHAVADSDGAVLEDERAALLRVAGDARQFAGIRPAQHLASGASVRLVAGAALHAAGAEAMRVRLVAERGDLRHVAGVAERELRLRQQVRRP